MPKKRPKKRKSRKPRPKAQRTKTSKVIPLLLGLCTFVGGVAAILTFIPRLSVDTSGSVRPQDPFGTVFSLSNQGSLELHDVLAVCRVDDLLTGGNNRFDNLGFYTPESKAALLSPAQTMTLGCQKSFDTHGQALSARATIVVSYRPDFLWWRKNIEFPMEGLRGDDGTWIWKRIAR